MTEALLALESGMVFRGRAFGKPGESEGEVVFNTALTGYQEILTDPSYRGQLVCMTYPLIGNYGVNLEDVESRRVFLSGFVVKELSRVVSNWRSTMSVDEYLKKEGIIGIEGVDTRALTVHLREKGAQKGIISTTDLDAASLVRKAKASRGVVGVDLVKEVAARPGDALFDNLLLQDPARAEARTAEFRVAAFDAGIKLNILRELKKRGCAVTVFAPTASKKDVLAAKPDGIFLSNGPGDPEVVSYLVETVRSLIGEVPIFGICLGHQMLGLALKGKTYKLKFGHHGANHPVMDLDTGRVAVTSQNHGFAVDVDSIPGKAVRITHLNLNDKTCEGMQHREAPLFSVQYHPEAAPGPHDSQYLFDKFTGMMRRAGGRHAQTD